MDGDTSQSKEKLVPVASLQEFFRDSVDTAMATNKVVMDDHTTHYVVNLLTLFSRSDALYDSTSEGLPLKPLAIMLSEALEAPSESVRNVMLQRVGDISLFVAGFFADGLRRSVVDLDYYVYMGGGAYHSLSVNIAGTVRGRAFGNVFDELAVKFQDIVDVLNEVRESARSGSDEDVLRLYEVWLKTGSRRSRRLLRELGVVPLPNARTRYEH